MAENKMTDHSTLENIENQAPQSMHPLLEAAFKYQKQIVIGVVAVVAIAALYSGITTYNNNAMTKAQAALGKILIEESGKEKIAKLDALLGTVPSSVKPAILLELAQASMNGGETEKAIGYWDQLAGEADQELQLVARMGKAKAQVLAGKYADAVTELKSLIGIVPAGFTTPVYRELAVAAEAAGNTTEALNAYRKLVEQPIADKQFIEYKIAQLEAK